LPARGKDFYAASNGRRAAVVEQSGPQRHFVLRHQPVACGVAAAAHLAACASGGRRRLVSRHDASRRIRAPSGPTGTTCGDHGAVRPRRQGPGARHREAVCGDETRADRALRNRCDFGDEIALTAGRRLS
jgi:hypothetical protein